MNTQPFSETGPLLSVLLLVGFIPVCVKTRIKLLKHFRFSKSFETNEKKFILMENAWQYVKSVRIQVSLVHIFPHSDRIRRDTPHISLFIPNEGKNGPENLRIRTIFPQRETLTDHFYITQYLKSSG